MHLQFKSELGIVDLITIDTSDTDQLRQFTPSSHLIIKRKKAKAFMLMNFTNDLEAGSSLYLYFNKKNYNWEITLDGQKIDYDDNYLKSLGFTNEKVVNFENSTVHIEWDANNKDVKRVYLYISDRQTFAKYTPSEKVLKDKRFVMSTTIVSLFQLKEGEGII